MRVLLMSALRRRHRSAEVNGPGFEPPSTELARAAVLGERIVFCPERDFSRAQ
jgi:hypothetical protein